MFAAILVFLSVLVGAVMALFVPWWSALWWLVAPLGVMLVLTFVSGTQVRRRPLLSVWLGLAGYPVVFLSSALAVYGGVVFAGVVPGLLGDLSDAVDAETVTAVSGVLSGAAATLIGALWLDNAKSPDGGFWPPGAYKAALAEAFRDAQFFKVPLNGSRPTELERLYGIVHDDRVRDGSVSGWAFAARLERARSVRVLDPGL